MNNINHPLHATLPTLTAPSNKIKQPTTSAQKHLPAGINIPTTPLYQRSATPLSTSTPPVYYQNHSYHVGSLLQQRRHLHYQQQKLQAFNACLDNGPQLLQQLPAIHRAISSHRPLPVLSGGDIFYKTPARQLFSLSQYAGKQVPASIEPIAQHVSQPSEPIASGHVLFQPLIQAYQQQLIRQLQQNSQSLTFQGYPAANTPPPQPMVYPMEQLQRWLSSPPDKLSPLTNFPANKPQQWPSPYPLFLRPSLNPIKQPLSMINESPNKPLQEHADWPLFNNRFQAFFYPETPTAYNKATISGSVSTPDSSSVTLPDITSRQKTPTNSASIKKTSAVLANQQPIHNSPLGRCVEFMTAHATQKKSSRQTLTALFDSWEGQVILGNRDHRDGHNLFANRENQPQHYSSDDFLTDVPNTLRFIDLYTTLIGSELKNKTTTARHHQNKKRERLTALKEVRAFVAELNPDNPASAQLCRLALQVCGRIRERRLVSQKTLPLCGGFGLLQCAWGNRPLNMTRIILSLARHRQCVVPTRVKGITKTLTVPPIDLSHYTEALADKLLLSTLYDLNSSSSTPGRDAVNASFLAMPSRVFNQNQWGRNDTPKANELFLQALGSCFTTKMPDPWRSLRQVKQLHSQKSSPRPTAQS